MNRYMETERSCTNTAEPVTLSSRIAISTAVYDFIYYQKNIIIKTLKGSFPD